MTDHNLNLNTLITPSEVLNMIRSLKFNKSPGRDGLPAKFYFPLYLVIH